MNFRNLRGYIVIAECGYVGVVYRLVVFYYDLELGFDFFVAVVGKKFNRIFSWSVYYLRFWGYL